MIDLSPRSQKILLGVSLVVIGTLAVLGVVYWGPQVSTSLRGLVESEDAGRGPGAQNVLATVGLTPGWATFGQALPQGAAQGDLQIGDLPTQTDVKTRWPDGSIRFAVLTAPVTQAGTYPITAVGNVRGKHTEAVGQGLSPVSEVSPEEVPVSVEPKAAEPEGGLPAGNEKVRTPKKNGSPKVTAPPIKGTITVRGVAHDLDFDSSQQGGGPGTADEERLWLNGENVIELHFEGVVDEATPFLRALADIRFYADGAARVDLIIENTLDIPAATLVPYDIDLRDASGRVLFARQGVRQGYLTRWRETFFFGGQESLVTPDVGSFFTANALPRFSAEVPDGGNPPREGPRFDILSQGDLENPMDAHGGRPELAPYPDWGAQYLMHPENMAMKDYLLAHGDLAGSWPVHLRSPQGQLMPIIDQRPDFWWDPRGTPGNKPAGDLGATGPLAPDVAHQPSLAYIPYLLTGDRYYADEMADWANYTLANTYQDAYYNERGGGWTGGCPQCGTPRFPGNWGLLSPNQSRGHGWGLRNLVDAAAYLPDDHPLKGYFQSKVENNLAWYDEKAQSPGAYGLSTIGPFDPPDGFPGLTVITPAFHYYAMWAIDHANQQGFTGGTALRDQFVRHLTGFVNWEADRGGLPAPFTTLSFTNYRLPLADAQGRVLQTYDDIYEIHQAYNVGAAGPGTYAVDARLMTLIGRTNNVPGAERAYNYIMSAGNMRGELPSRAGWWVEL